LTDEFKAKAIFSRQHAFFRNLRNINDLGRDIFFFRDWAWSFDPGLGESSCEVTLF
tara:strand:+ start:99 stop:266 length:168 start_codon:yes stop_codon:yes gene_type:complete